MNKTEIEWILDSDSYEEDWTPRLHEELVEVAVGAFAGVLGVSLAKLVLVLWIWMGRWVA